MKALLADSRSAETRRAYARDLADFFAWHGYAEPTPEAVSAFCALDTASLALTLNGYKADLRARHLSPATINRRLAALRALLRMARRFGAQVPDPAGLVTSEKSRAYRDTRGPALSDAARLLRAPDRNTLRGKRDYALLVLFCENALRRGELHRCDVADFDPIGERLSIIGKGRTEKAPVTISKVAVAALSEYLQARGPVAPDAPLFANVARFSDGTERLSGRGMLYVIDTYGREVLGRPLHPHALRHMAITAYLDATEGDIRGAQRLSRHADIRTLTIYDDNRADLQGRATSMLSALLHGRSAA
jgi:integrase/recombinase XerC